MTLPGMRPRSDTWKPLRRDGGGLRPPDGPNAGARVVVGAAPVAVPVLLARLTRHGLPSMQSQAARPRLRHGVHAPPDHVRASSAASVCGWTPVKAPAERRVLCAPVDRRITCQRRT